MDQHTPAEADPSPGLVLTQATVHAPASQQLSDFSEGSSSSDDDSSDEENTMDP